MALAASPPPSTSATPAYGAHSSPSMASRTLGQGPIASGSGTSRLSGSSSSMVLTPQTMSSFKPAKVFRDHVGQGCSITSLSFDDRGEALVTAGDDDSIHVFDCRSGKHQKHSKSGKYGAHLARFTHAKNTIIYASSKDEGENHIRYLSIHDNVYLRYFKGHKKRVVSLEMSPADDTFLSGSVDDTVRLWDTRSSTCSGLLNVAGVPSVAYDPSGLIFAVTTNLKSTTLLYDIRKLDVEPFAEITVNDPILASQSWPPKLPTFTSVKFSNDGNFMLVGTTSGTHYVLHSFNYNVVARLEVPEGIGNENNANGISGEETSWTPDGRYVLCGSNDGKIYVFDVNPPAAELAKMTGRPPAGEKCTLKPLRVLEGHKHTPSRVVRFNPRYGMFVSGGTGELAFWLSDPTKDPADEA